MGGGRRGIAGFPRGGASQAARGAHHRCCGRKPAGARGRAGGLRSRSSRGGLGRGPGSGGGAEGAPGAALGFWLRTMKWAPASRGGKARVAPGRTLVSAGRRGAAAAARAPPFRTVVPPPAAPAHAHASRARGRRRPVPVTHPLAGPPPSAEASGSCLRTRAHSWLDGYLRTMGTRSAHRTARGGGGGGGARTGPLSASLRNHAGRAGESPSTHSEYKTLTDIVT